MSVGQLSTIDAGAHVKKLRVLREMMKKESAVVRCCGG